MGAQPTFPMAPPNPPGTARTARPTPSTPLGPLSTPYPASSSSSPQPNGDAAGTMLGICSCCGLQTGLRGPGAPAATDTTPDCRVPSCFPRRQRRRPASPPPPSSHSVVPPTRLGRWRLQVRARVRLQAARLAQVTRWRARIAADRAIVVNVIPPVEDTEPPDAAGAGAPTRWPRLIGLPRVRFRLPTMPSVPSLLRRRTSDASDPEPGALEPPAPPSEYAPSEVTCQTRRTSLDYDAFGPTIADRLKSQPRRNSW